MTSGTLQEVSPSDRAQLERLEDFFVNASVGFAIADAGGRLLSANRALAMLLGFDDRAECEGLVLTERFLDAQLAELVEERVRAGETVTNVEVELQGRTREACRATVDVSGRVEEGRLAATRWIARPSLTHTIPSVHPDGESFADAPPDTDAARWVQRLMDEVDVRDAIAEMSEERRSARLADLEDFFEEAPAAIHCVAVNGDVVHANRTDLANVGFLEAREEYVGHHIGQVYADQALLEDLLGRLGSGTPIVNVRSRLRRRDGSLLPVVIYSSGRVADGTFENTRCVVFEDPDPAGEPTSLRGFSWPPQS